MIAEPITGKVKDGKFVPDSPDGFKGAFRLHEGRKVVLNIKRWQPVRSPEANAYYWAVVVVFWMKEQGESDSITMHEILKTAYNYKSVQIGEEVLRVPLSTKKMESGPFGQFVDRCKEGFRENFGGIIPPPSSAVSLQMIEEYNQLGNGG